MNGRAGAGGGGRRAGGLSVELLLAVGLGASMALNVMTLLEKRRQRQRGAKSSEGAGGTEGVDGGGFDICRPPKVRVGLASPRRRTDSSCLQVEPNVDKACLEPVVSRLEKHIAGAEGTEAAERRPPLTVGVAGGSGSGKTTFARALYEALGPEHVTYLTHDSYYKDLSHLPHAERAKANFDHPNALDTALLVEHVRRLKAGETVAVPVYDFATHCRLEATTPTEPRPIILVEGILIFSEPELVKELAIKVFIDTESDLRLIRRIHRDVKERGRSLESIVSQYVKTVRPMHMEFVETSKRFADLIIPLGLNGVALDMFLCRLQQEIGGELEEAVGLLDRGDRHGRLVSLGKHGSLSL